MIVHLSVLGVIVVMGALYDRNFTYNKLVNKNYVMRAFPWIVVFGYLAFLAAMRSGMNDTLLYMSSFEKAEGTVQGAMNSWITMDSKYRFTEMLANLFKAFISENYHTWFAFWATIESVLFICVFRRECYGITIPCYFFFASTLYYNYFSMMRQWMAVAITFFGFLFLRDKKWIKYVICCIAAGLFHPSAYFCILFALLAIGKPWKGRQNIIMLGASFAIVFMNPLMSALESVAEGGTYDYAIDAMQMNTGSSLMRGIIALVPVALALIYKKQIESDDNYSIDICVNFSILNCLLNIIASMTSGLFVIRLAMYLMPYNAILFSYLLRKVNMGKNKQIILMCFYIFYIVFYWYQMSHQGSWEYISDIIGTFSY